MPTAFQRARSPEQVKARRDAILSAARELLADRPLTEVTLGMLGDRAGVAKSAVLRYFDSREAVFVALLDTQWVAWLDDLELRLAALPTPPATATGYAAERTVAAELAESIADRPLLCELIGTMAGVLERNIGIDVARDFKLRTAAHGIRFETAMRSAVPGLSGPAAAEFAAMALVTVAGLMSFAHPTAAVAQVHAELGIPDMAAAFGERLRVCLTAELIGLRVGVSSEG